jgi:hypothetical protein
LISSLQLFPDPAMKYCRQVEELQSKVEQLSARCAEQQQELELLKVVKKIFFSICLMV